MTLISPSSRSIHSLSSSKNEAIVATCNLAGLEEHLRAIERISPNLINSRTFIVVANLKERKILYANDSLLKAIDIKKDELSNDYLTYLSLVTPSQRPLLKWHINWLNTINSNIPLHERKHQTTQIVGCRLALANGREMVSFISSTNLVNSPEGLPEVVVYIIENISHLYKADFLWFRNSYNNNPLFVRSFHGGLNQNFGQDIISEREVEVLRKIAQGYESTQIASSLNISINTVNNHRKNMVARVGVRDTTALLQIAQWCGWLEEGYFFL